MSNTNSISWQWLAFDELSTLQLYQLLKLRQDVFVIEQDCIYPDMDDLDFKCIHLLGHDGDDLVAYLRLIPSSIEPLKILPEATIAFGRIVTNPKKRQGGLGLKMMAEAMNYAQTNYPTHYVQLGAQCYLQAFYEKFNFKVISEPYDEDGIMHVDMCYKK